MKNYMNKYRSGKSEENQCHNVGMCEECG
jgi:hypothetical protein